MGTGESVCILGKKRLRKSTCSTEEKGKIVAIQLLQVQGELLDRMLLASWDLRELHFFCL